MPAAGWRSFVCAVGLALLVPKAAVTQEQTRYKLELTAIVEARPGELDARQRKTIFQQVARIWKPYGFDVCVRPEVNDRCPVPDFLVRVVLGDRRTRPAPETIGWIQFLDTGQPHNVVYASLDGAHLALERARIGGHLLSLEPFPIRQRFLLQSVARSIAHELGHYLLGSKTHAERGLMRERFPVSDLLDPGIARFRLEPDELPMLHRMVALVAQK